MEKVDADEALADLRELALLSGEYPDVAEAFRHLIDEGAAVLQIDHMTAKSAGNTICRYKVAEPLKVCLAAIRAGNLQSKNTE